MARKRAAGAPKPRLLDIAEVSGVSTATVSRVLNGKPGVGDDVRNSVLAALDMLGYERPAALRHKTAGLVGVVVPELSNPIFPAIAQGLESRLSQHGYTALLCTQSPGGTTEDESIELLLGQGVSGIIFVSGLHADASQSHDRYHDLRRRGIPLAFINGWADGVDGTFVATDDAVGMDSAVRHLVSLGHTRIGLLIGPDRLVPAQRKITSFTTALADHLGLEDAEPHIFRTLYTLEGGHAAAERLVESGHTALICGSDLMALGAIRGVRGRGLRVPEDVSVIGYDDSPLIAFVDPPLTTVHQPVTALCQAVVSAVIGEIDGNPGPRTELLYRPELIVRASTTAAPKDGVTASA
ncbi:MAG: LacI family DNA-binding transcriptional regulator [Propionicimonas sp.]|uniref:LacI family DNA-binding transcriptional regulator n=1 Tax=Propionicimonas sp. TaxID=1955623 RepID=UPI003D1452B8